MPTHSALYITVYMKVSIVLKFCVIKVVISDKNTNKADNVRYASVDDCKTKNYLED